MIREAEEEAAHESAAQASMMLSGGAVPPATFLLSPAVSTNYMLPSENFEGFTIMHDEHALRAALAAVAAVSGDMSITSTHMPTIHETK